MTKSSLFILLMLSGIFTAGAAETSGMKAGLWEVKQTKNVVDGKDMTAQMAASQQKMQQAMEKMTPEQKQQMESMMKGMGSGMGPNSAAKDGSMRICISPAMAAKNTPMVDKDGHCEPAKVTRSGNKSTFEFNCTHNGRTTVGTGESTYNGDTVFTNVNMAMTDAKGHHTMQSESQMTYLGSDCQGIKPTDQMLKEMKEMQGAKQKK